VDRRLDWTLVSDRRAQPGQRLESRPTTALPDG
jgi:hypothetical protein